jgi:ketosteroid isomerase-like protein
MYRHLAGTLLAVLASGCARLPSRAAAPQPMATADSHQLLAAERAVLQAEHASVRAALRGDADGFASFLTDEFVALRSSGQFTDKAAWSGAIRSGTTRYDSVSLRDLRVRFPRPDVAVVTGAFTQVGVADGRDNSRSGVYINTWIRTGTGWRLVSSGFVRVAP